MKTIYTIGYGNDKPEVFLQRLKDAGVDLVIDVRRMNSGAWCNKYRSGNSMRNFLMLDGGIAYSPWIWLANKCESLSEYSNWLNNEGMKSVTLLAESIENAVEANDRICCLLCAERDVYKDGEVNCHREYVGKAVVEMLGEEWEVCHL